MPVIRPTIAPVIAPTIPPVGGDGLSWESGGVAVGSLESRIIAAALAVGGVAPIIFVPRTSTVDAAAVGSYRNLGGAGGNATEATNKPAYSQTAINGRPGIAFDGVNDRLTTAAIDLSAYAAFAYIALLQDTTAANSIVFEFTSDFTAIDGGFALAVNNGVAADLTAGHGTALSQARSAASFALASAGVVTGTGDMGLAIDEAEIRHNGTNVTASRPTNGNTAGALANAALTLGIRPGGTLPWAGSMGPFALLCRTTSLATLLPAVAIVEQLIRSEYGV